MTTEAQVNLVPKVFREVAPYNFSRIFIQNDFALGVGHAIKLTFSLPNEEGQYGKDKEGTVQFEVLAIPTYDGSMIASVDDLNEHISKIRDAEVQVMNDFDVPWVQQTKQKFPKVPKRRVRKQRADDESEDDEEEEEDDEDDEEEEDDDEEEEDKDSNTDSGDGSDKSEKKEKEGSDEDDDDEDADSAQKSSKSKGKPKPYSRGQKAQAASKKKTKRSGVDSDDEDDYIPYEEMTPE